MTGTSSYRRAFNLSSFHVPDFQALSNTDPEKPKATKSKNLIIDFDPGNPHLENDVTIIKLLLNDQNIALKSSANFKPESEIEGRDPLLEGFIDVVRDHVRNNGPIESLILNGHGATLKIGNKGLAVTIDTEDALRALERLSQEEFEGKPLCREIVLNGCNTLNYVGPEKVEFLHDYAVRNQTDIIGLVSSLYYPEDDGIYWKDTNELAYFGRYIQFGADGRVTADEYNKDNFPEEYVAQLEQGWEKYYLQPGVTYDEALENHKNVDGAKQHSDALFRLGYISGDM